MTLSRSVLGLVIGLVAACNVHALDAGGAKEVVDKFLASQPAEQGSANAFAQQIADVNGDGRTDIVLIWNVLGPTSA